MQSDLASHLEKLLNRLRQEKALLDQAIMDLERLDEGRKRPRGRPPGPTNGETRFTSVEAVAASAEIG